MRIAYAWLLLVLVLSNGIGGFLCFEIRQLVEIQHEMNAAEQTIAQQFQKETGSESVVKMLDEKQVIPKGNVYGDFAFATEVNGETVYYTLLDDSTDVQAVTQTTKMPTSSNDDRALLLKSLFAEFEVTQPNYFSSSVLTPFQTIFYLPQSPSKAHINILTPPPNFA